MPWRVQRFRNRQVLEGCLRVGEQLVRGGAAGQRAAPAVDSVGVVVGGDER